MVTARCHFELRTLVAAPAELCFDLSRDVDLHLRGFRHTGERVVAGVRHGLLGLGDEVTWEGRHLGVWQQLTSRITAYDRPYFFQDTMVRGAFAAFQHDHLFEEADGQTSMIDVVRFQAPWGVLGRLAEVALLKRYLKRLIGERSLLIKHEAERRRVEPRGQLQ